jgi:transposase
MIRMLIVGYCCGIRSERKLCQEVELLLAYRWFCKLDLGDKVPHHSTFSENRLGRFRESDLLRDNSLSAWCGQRWRWAWLGAKALLSV